MVIIGYLSYYRNWYNAEIIAPNNKTQKYKNVLGHRRKQNAVIIKKIAFLETEYFSCALELDLKILWPTKKKAKKAFQNGGSIVGGTRRAENKRMLRERWTLIGCQRCNTGNKLESV